MPQRLLVLGMVCVLTGGMAAAAAEDPPLERVRSTQPRIMMVLAEGAARSPLFRQLIDRLNATDVIVYVEPSNDLPQRLAGRTTLLSSCHHVRYIRVQVRAEVPFDQLIPLLGHELQHALEIARRPDVRDQESMRTLYAEIGRAASHATDAYETAAARLIEAGIRRDVVATTMLVGSRLMSGSLPIGLR
jgi:hypothetical protein